MKQIDLSKTALGIELGSTRIKAVLLDESYLPIASGSYTWENQLINGVWTYALSDTETGLQTCFAELKADCIYLLFYRKKPSASAMPPQLFSHLFYSFH